MFYVYSPNGVAQKKKNKKLNSKIDNHEELKWHAVQKCITALL